MYYTIGITGPKRSGKSTLARMLDDRLTLYPDRKAGDYHVITQPFAGPMYAMLRPLLALVQNVEVDQNFIDSDDKDTVILEPFGVTLRHMAQTLGTDWGRDMINPALWVLAMQRICETESNGNKWPRIVLIPDVRFEDEAAFVREHGLLIHLDRAGLQRADTHRSEKGVKPLDGDYFIQQRTLSDLHREAEHATPIILQRFAAAVSASGNHYATLDLKP